MEGSALEARHVYQIFISHGRAGERALTALRDLSLAVARGEFVSLVGPSGCGKSTVLNLFAGLVKPVEGEILHDGRPVLGVNTRAGYVPQDDHLLPWRNALENAELAMELKGVPRRERREKARAYLERVGLAGFEKAYPHELSGGMRKRVSIVRTLADESVNVILMDEPFGPLDAQTRLVLQDELLQLWQGSGRTVVFVTHDLVEAIALSDRIAVFSSPPGTIKSVRETGIPRPRDVFHIHQSPGFDEVYDRLWQALRSELADGPHPGGARS
ncbi:MAG: ABC transporter ATP-binding protein [Vicinamibacteria bacterium]